MSIGTYWQIVSKKPEETLKIGKKIGKKCRGGEVFLLISDLGGGKTTFTKGLAEGMGSKDVVNSPTFTISQVYTCHNGLYLHHFDFYRLKEAGMVAHELAEVVEDPHAVVVVEWGDVVSDVLPEKRITIEINRQVEHEDLRLLTFNLLPELSYLNMETKS